MKKMFRSFLMLLLLIFIVSVFFHQPILFAAAQFLKLDCEALPQESDVIIVLGGEIDGERTRKAAALYHQGIAPKLMLSDGTQMSWRTKAIDEMVALAEVSGVPRSDRILERRSRSTHENAVYTKELMLERGYDSAVVVSSDWHMRRTQFIFDKVYRDTAVQLSYCGMPDFQSDFEAWWADGEKQQTVLTEWARLGVYWIRYGFANL